MLHRRVSLLGLFAVLVLLFGCVTENNIASDSPDILVETDPISLPGSSDDIFVASYSPFSKNGVTLERTVLVSTIRDSNYSSFNELSDLDVVTIFSHYTSFSRAADDPLSACDNSLGLVVSCIDARTCAELCSKNSLSCQSMYEKYPGPLGDAVFSYVLTKRDFDSTRDEVRSMIQNLRSLDDTELADLTISLERLSNDVIAIQASPLYQYGPLSLCDADSFDLVPLATLKDMVGRYSTSRSYRYDIYLHVTRPESSTSGAEITVKEPLISDDRESLLPSGKTTIESSGTSGLLVFEPVSKDESILHYSFVSSESPDTVLSQFKRPALSIRTLDLSFLDPALAVISLFFALTGNLILSIALGIALSIIILIVIYNFVQIIIYTAISGSLSKSALTLSFRKAFGRPRVHWKTDALLSGVLLVFGFALCALTVKPLAAFPSLTALADLIFYADPLAIVGGLAVFSGLLLGYLSLENRVKITYLESLYGRELKADKDVMVAQIAELKGRYQELKSLIEKQTRENFDVGEEHDVLATISIERLDILSKSPDSAAKKVVEDSLLRIDGAVRSLLEKRKTADENWLRWSDLISKQLSESDQVYTSSLIAIPKSLRSWALSRHVKEHPHDALSFEGDSIRKKATTLDRQVGSLFDDGLLNGLVILKSDKVIFSRLANNPSGTVINVLSVRLVLYLRSLLRQLRQNSYSSFASVGDSTVLAIVKQDSFESILLIPKDKFKDALEESKRLLKKLPV